MLGSHTFSTPATQMILYHDYVLWMGDLNFRLAADPAELSAEAVIRRVEAGDTAALLQLDQLTIARNNGDAFSELDETKPKFAPRLKLKLVFRHFRLITLLSSLQLQVQGGHPAVRHQARPRLDGPGAAQSQRGQL